MVLLIVMAITIISAGFIARADMQLACGVNTDMRMQMDQLAASALEHARGLLLRPQIASTWYWTGGQNQQLLGGTPDYYDVAVTRDESDPTDYCTYNITCEAYRLRAGDKVGSVGLSGVLRMDPCIAMWTETDVALRQKWTLHGDMYAKGCVTNLAPAGLPALDGDVFALDLVGTSVGRKLDLADLSLGWPPVTTTYANSTYGLPAALTATLNEDPGSVHIWKRTGDLVLGPGVTVEGMLLVTETLTVSGSGSRITAAKNLPALYVGGDLVLEDANGLTVEGLAVVDGHLRVRENATDITFLGGLYLRGTITEITADASGNGHHALVQGSPTWIGGRWGSGGALQFDGAEDYVDGGNSPLFDISEQITVAAWVQTEDAGNGQDNPFVTKGDHAYALGHSNGNRIEFSIYDGGWWTAQSSLVDASSFDGQWHHVAGTYDGSDVKLYVDGALQPTTSSHAGTIAISPQHSVCIGHNAEWPDRDYQGAIDDARIYNRALSPEEILLIRDGGSVLGLVAQWRLNGPGSRVTILAEPARASIISKIGAERKHWSPAADAFFRSIERLP